MEIVYTEIRLHIKANMKPDPATRWYNCGLNLRPLSCQSDILPTGIYGVPSQVGKSGNCSQRILVTLLSWNQTTAFVALVSKQSTKVRRSLFIPFKIKTMNLWTMEGFGLEMLFIIFYSVKSFNDMIQFPTVLSSYT